MAAQRIVITVGNSSPVKRHKHRRPTGRPGRNTGIWGGLSRGQPTGAVWGHSTMGSNRWTAFGQKGRSMQMGKILTPKNIRTGVYAAKTGGRIAVAGGRMAFGAGRAAVGFIRKRSAKPSYEPMQRPKHLYEKYPNG